MPIKSTLISKGTKLYYASAKFRELQMDKIMHNEQVPDYPSKKNLFLGGHIDALGYSNTVNDLGVYYSLSYGSKPERYLSDNFNVTHVYTVKQDIKLMNLMDRGNIGYLLYDDPKSPFHISKIGIPVHKNNSPYNTVMRSSDGKKILKASGIDSRNKEQYIYSGFLLLVAATGFYLKALKRNSSIFYDYTIIELLRKYVEHSSLNIDGWYQPETPTFHIEYAIFYPRSTLKPDYNSPLSWKSHLPDISSMTIKQKIKYYLGIVEKWRLDRISRSEETIDEQKAAIKALREYGTNSLIYKDEVSATGENVPISTLINQLQSIIDHELKVISDIKNDIPSAVKLKRSQGIKTSIQVYYNQKTHSCNFGGCEKTVTFETNDCKQSMDDLVKEMRLYPNADTLHHNGQTIADHSIWVTRAAHKWLGFVDHPWTIGIDPSLRNLTLISAFLHDIGKIGDNDTKSLVKNNVKPDHPYRGFNYIMKWLDFKFIDRVDARLDILNTCNVRSAFSIATVATVIALHHHFGELLMSMEYLLPSKLSFFKGPHVLMMTVSKYISHPRIDGSLSGNSTLILNVLDTMVEFKYILYYLDFLNYYEMSGGNLNDKKELHQSLLILLAVSAADVYGSHEVAEATQKYSIYDASTSQILDPHILNNITNKHDSIPEIFRGYYNYLYYTIGIKERSNIIAFADTVDDPKSFMEAWKHFKGLLNHIEDPEKFRLPFIFSRIGVDSSEIFLTQLLRLLKTGQLPYGLCTKKLPIMLCKELLGTSSKQDPMVKMFKTHRHRGMSQQAPDLGTVPVTASKFSSQAPF